ncbi:MAG TPA: RNA polymerase sigma factor [Xanthobacteraceae bacterium]|nr:RNA polymerase sigma factor [Xanthobacteraceae bacterium]
MPLGIAAQVTSSETELIDRARRRDPGAVRTIIQQHNQRLYRIARSILRDDAEAEDALQDAYLRAFTHLQDFRGEAQLGTWLSRIVINEALGRRRRRQHQAIVTDVPSPSPAAEVIPFPINNPDPETSMAQREIRALLERAIDNLPDAFRTVLVARVIEGMSVEETADVLELRPETVKTRLHRARKLLREEMEKHVGPVLNDAFPFAGRRCERVAEAVLMRLGLN